MRLLVSATAAGDGDIVDLAIDCEDDATIADIARQLAAQVRPQPQAQIVHTAGRHLGVVGESVFDDGPGEGAGVPPTLYLGSVPLDPTTKVAESDLRNGALVGVGVPLPDVFAERTGVVQVRTVSGPGAGHIDYLSAGSHDVGGRVGAAVRLRGEDAPPVALRLDVTVDGSVTVTPEPSLAGVMLPPPPRERPLDGPIVVPKDEEPEPAKKKKKKKARRFNKRMEELARLKHPNLTVDPEADRPFMHLDRVPLDGPVTWPPGGAVVVGDTVLELALPADPDASLSPSPGGVTLDYNRPPRLLPPPRQTEFRLPNEPRKPDKEPLPWAIAMAPMIMGGAMFYFTRSPFSLMIMVLSPIMMLSRWRSSRHQRQTRFSTDMKTYVERMRNIENQAYRGLVAERSARRRDVPDPAALLLFATGPRSRLWERRRTDPDWMLVRVGTADVPSEVSLTDPGREDHERVLHWTAPDVPVGVPLEQAGVTGVAGHDDVRRQVAGWMVAQIAALHSPADIEMVVLSDPEGGAAWNWMRWLPHVRRGEASEIIAGIGADDETTSRRVAELMAIMEQRKAAAADRGGGLMSSRNISFPPLLVVLDGARRIRLMPGLITLLREGPRLGMFFLCIDADERLLPEECRAVVSVGPTSTSVRHTGQPTIEGIRLDIVPPEWCERLGRALAPVKDVSSEDLSSSLPMSSRLLDVLKLDPPTPEAIVQWWTTVGRTTKAIIGEGMDGPFSVDVRADGPHGLVAGTTGSGKSELLQTLIASLAVANRPDEMTFVLVDYKGGAAFKDCNNLAHTVGMVTDLDGHLTTRALESLAAELHRREHQLARAGKKDIEDYLAAKGPDDEPMPRLMIIIDEFAALVTELPDFVKGLVDIARRGRSLGVHLLLATQRPAGVVSAEIKSNTNLRIALRVTDGNDSQDVIEAKDAAEISKSTPGRAYARLGASSLVPFQSSRVGGRPTAPDAEVSVDLRQLSWESLGRPPERTESSDADEDVSIPSDLESLVTAINAASERTGIGAPPPPWLPPLADSVTLDEVLADPAGAVERGREIRIPFGIVDVPREQRRAVASYDLSGGGHLSIVGAPRSGRSTVLRAVAGVVGRTLSPRDVHLFGIDCGNNALLPMVGLPHTGAVVSRDQPDRLSRLSARIRAEIGRRQQILAEQGFADLSEQRANAAPEARLPYILILFDRWEGFVQSFENFDSGRLIDQWMQIMQEGPGVGVKVVMASDRTTLVGRISALMEDKLMLRMTDNADFGAIGMSPKKVPESMPAGRAFRTEGLLETQVALLVDDPEGTAQVAALQTLAREAKERHADVPRKYLPFRVDPLPTRITHADAMALAERPLAPTELPVAVGGDTLTLRTLDAIDHGPGILVLGPRRSGRSTTLLTMTTSMLERGWKLLVITPRRSPLSALAGRDGVEAVINLEAEKDEVTKLYEGMVPEKGGRPTAVVIDDLELMGVDGWMVDLMTKHLPKLRDTGSAIVAAGTTDDLGSSYRGPAAVLKKSRSGVLLSPGAPADGDHFGIKLPRSLTGGMPPGRGLFVAAGQWQLVQVPETTT